MPRLRPVSKDEASPEIRAVYQKYFGDRDPVKEPGTATGTPGNWWTVHALDPAIFQHCLDGFALTIGENASFDPKLRELAITRTGFNIGSQFVFSQHCKGARAAGVTEAQIAAIPSWGSSSEFSDVERAVLAYADELTLGRGRVQDATFEALQKNFSDQEILQLSYAVCMYTLHATMTKALRLEYDDTAERVVEIPMPS